MINEATIKSVCAAKILINKSIFKYHKVFDFVAYTLRQVWVIQDALAKPDTQACLLTRE